MKKMSFFTILLMINCYLVFPQIAINADGSAPDPSAGLDISYTTKGLLLPRMTQSQISSILNPADGLIVYCTTDGKFYAYVANTNTWKEILYGPGTISPASCGPPIIIEHVEGNVAPVTKTTIYGIVTNIPGEPTKCWITSNLGSDHQADSVDDATEASAGWYWQFNRMQGYKHDGINRTPNTNWITDINENSDWLANNDPCIFLLSDGWRLPTSTEWTNVYISGGWTDWNGPWNSPLKLHAAGRLGNSDGSLNFRGLHGYYWSSSQGELTYTAQYLNFSNSNCYMTSNYKAFGFTARCIKEVMR